MYTEVIKLIVYNKVYTLHAVCKSGHTACDLRTPALCMRSRQLCRWARLLAHKTQRVAEFKFLSSWGVCMNCTRSQDAIRTNQPNRGSLGLVRSGLRDYQAACSQKERRLHVRHNSVHKLQNQQCTPRPALATQRRSMQKKLIKC